MFSHTEDYINHLLISLRIKSPTELTIDHIASQLQIKVKYWEFTSESSYYKGKYLIFLNEEGSKEKQWQDFCHELAHIQWHTGRQENMPKMFMQLQEWQANYFAYHFCVPTFMIEGLGELSIPGIVDLFNVEYDFAERRLEMYQSKLFYEGVAENAK